MGENKARLTNTEQIKKLEEVIAEKLAEENPTQELWCRYQETYMFIDQN